MISCVPACCWPEQDEARARSANTETAFDPDLVQQLPRTLEHKAAANNKLSRFYAIKGDLQALEGPVLAQRGR